jgi:hypothetical protein
MSLQSLKRGMRKGIKSLVEQDGDISLENRKGFPSSFKGIKAQPLHLNFPHILDTTTFQELIHQRSLQEICLIVYFKSMKQT